MKKLKNVYAQVCGTRNLYRAAHATLLKGRRFTSEGARFKYQLERNICRIQEKLRTLQYKHGKYEQFTIYDPKERVILAAPLKDRIVHHALNDVVAPWIDGKYIFDSYACRKGKGTHAAILRAQRFLNACEYAVHLDVEKYFPSVDHQIVKEVLRKHIEDEQVLWLFEHIIYSPVQRSYAKKTGAFKNQLALFANEKDSQRERGLPIGNLTSQFLANLYMNELDQFVKHKLKCRYYIRYLDDMVFFHHSKAGLKKYVDDIRAFCQERLRLQLHDCSGPIYHKRGLTFLGFRIFRHHKRLKSQNITRFVKRQKMLEKLFQNGDITKENMLKSRQSWYSHASFGDTAGLRQSLSQRYPVDVVWQA